MINAHSYSMVRTAAAFTLLWLTTAAAAKDQYVTTDGRTIAPLEIFQNCAECPEMITLPTGSFVIGAPLEQSNFFICFGIHPSPVSQ